MAPWTIAAVQMDCRLAEIDANLDTVCQRLHAAADQGARLVVFPECALTGYGYATRADAVKVSDTLPGKATEWLARECKARDVFALVGMIERDGDKLYNAAVLVGPTGFIAGYRKVHLPCIGLDRYVDPGDRAFAVHDLGGLKLGIGICFDLSFPEASRLLTLAGADLIALPTNWAPPSQKMADLVCRVRALENHVYFCCVNRVGDETGFHYIGHSGIVDCAGEFLARAAHDEEAIITATIEPEKARQKKTVVCTGEYEIDRINWRRPDLYGPLAERR